MYRIGGIGTSGWQWPWISGKDGGNQSPCVHNGLSNRSQSHALVIGKESSSPSIPGRYRHGLLNQATIVQLVNKVPSFLMKLPLWGYAYFIRGKWWVIQIGRKSYQVTAYHKLYGKVVSCAQWSNWLWVAQWFHWSRSKCLQHLSAREPESRTGWGKRNKSYF